MQGEDGDCNTGRLRRLVLCEEDQIGGILRVKGIAFVIAVEGDRNQARALEFFLVHFGGVEVVGGGRQLADRGPNRVKMIVSPMEGEGFAGFFPLAEHFDRVSGLRMREGFFEVKIAEFVQAG